MAEERVQRRLAAILAADVVGYSRMMSLDETGTLSRLKKLRQEVFAPKTKQYGGRTFKTTGDGAFVEFKSVVDAVESATDIQEAIATLNAEASEDQRILLRIGISLGDVIVEGNDLYGNGVNVASRLEGLAEPGGICVSGNVHEHLGRSLDVNFEDLGEQSVKNIDQPVRCYRVHLDAGSARSTKTPISNKPAVAVLPFENMSGDPEQEYFADGLTEDIISALALWRSFPVIARNSTFAYKGKSPDVRKVGDELNAKYVVEGSVRKAAERVRITAQLIDAATGYQLWTEQYDRDLTDIFDVQDEVTQRIAATIEPALQNAEQKRLSSSSTELIEAWDLCIQGFSLIYQKNKGANDRAKEKFKEAIELDPDYSRAWTGLAYTYGRDWRLGFGTSREEAAQKFMEAARRSVELDELNSEARVMLGRAYRIAGQVDNSLAELRRAVELNPQDSLANWSLGAILYIVGNAEEAIPWLERALDINPLDPQNYVVETHLAAANLCAGRYETAAELGRKAIRQRPDYIDSHVTLAAALGYLGREDDAQQAVADFRDEAWDFAQNHPAFCEKTKNCYLHGLRKAQLQDSLPDRGKSLPLPDKPSIAVLPFVNMSGDAEQEYFADGIAEDIITALSRFSWFFVIARNSSFSYKGTSPNIRRVAQELGVQYVLEGSVRKAANRVRVTAQLIDALTGRHIWAERYDRELTDIFAVQDEITSSITGAVAPSFVSAEARRIERKVPESFDAWDYAIRGNWHLWQLGKEHLAEAKRLFQAAIDLDPSSSMALSGLAMVHSYEVVWGWADDPAKSRVMADEMAQRAVAADDNDAWAHAAIANVLMHKRQNAESMEACRRALELNPNLALAEGFLALGHGWFGDYDEAVLHADVAARLSPRDPAQAWWHLARVSAAFVTGRYEEQVEWGRKMTAATPDHPGGWRMLAVGCAYLDRMDEARAAIQQLLRLVPHITVEQIRASGPGVQPQDLDRLLEGLRKAGLPEK